MSHEPFDQSLKSRIYSLETDVPDYLWEAVDQKLRARRKIRLLLLIIPLILGTFWLTTKVFEPSSAPAPDLSVIHLNKSKAYQPFLIDNENENKPQVILQAESSILVREIGERNSNAIQSITPSIQSTNQIEINHELIAVPADPITHNNQPQIISKASSVDSAFHHKDLKNNRLLPLDRLELRPQINLKDPKIDICPSFKSGVPLNLFLELSLMGGFPQKSLTLRDPELINYIDLREKTEKSISSFSLQGLIGLEIGDQFEIKTGIGLTRIYEVFDYIDESASRTITNIITDTILINGEPRIRTDTTIVIEYGQRIKLSQNRYTHLDFPLLAAYKFRVQEHQFFIQGGPIFNLSLWTQGDILSADGHIISIDTKNSTTSYFRSRSGLDISAAIGYELQLNEVNRLRFMASYRQAMDDLTITGNSIGQRYQHIHLGLSWNHQF